MNNQIDHTEKDLISLEQRIKSAINQIKNGQSTPAISGIGKLLKLLKTIDEASYCKHLEEYKPVSRGIIVKSPTINPFIGEAHITIDEVRKIVKNKKDLSLSDSERLKKINEDVDLICRSSKSDDFSDDELRKGPKQLKESKIKVPKIKVPRTPKIKAAGETGRDRSPIIFEGKEYGKGPFVLAIVKKHFESNPKMSLSELKKAFPDHLIKGYGIFQTKAKAEEFSVKRKRFFLNPEHLLKVGSETIAVTNQIGIGNIAPVLEQIKALGYKFEANFNL